MKNILLIDDDYDHLAALSLILTDAGYRVIPKSDVASALAVLKADIRIDLIIIDYKCPGLNVSICPTMLRRSQPTVPIIALARDTGAEIDLKAMSLGAHDYVSKPVRGDELRSLVETALGRTDW